MSAHVMSSTAMVPESWFMAQKAKPNHITSIDFDRLSPILRTLLITDGTVTRFLEAYTLEPVIVTLVSQHSTQLHSESTFLRLPKNAEVILRQVQLHGARTGKCYAVASSLIHPSLLNTLPASNDPESQAQGIGRLLVNSQTEQHRELLWFGRESSEHASVEAKALGAQNWITRTYQIHMKGRPMMVISEWFDPACF